MNKFICLNCKQLKEKPKTPDIITEDNLWIVAGGMCKECYDKLKTERKF